MVARSQPDLSNSAAQDRSGAHAELVALRIGHNDMVIVGVHSMQYD